MIAEVVRIIGPNSHTINANGENSSVQSVCFAARGTGSLLLCLFLERGVCVGGRTNVAEFTAADPVFLPGVETLNELSSE